jgi:chemosensory pili system protein ChpA (sensor histidine kinase/response regulator)
MAHWLLFLRWMFKTILFVEDSEVESIAYSNILQKAGFCIHPAKDGLEAMRLLNNIVPDLILLDLLLPRFDGVEVLKYIRSRAHLKNVPVVIFSTNSIIDSEDEPLLQAAARRILKSQCNPSMLLQCIHEVLDKQGEETSPANGHAHNGAPRKSEAAGGGITIFGVIGDELAKGGV